MSALNAILLTAVSSPAQATSDKESLEAQERDLRAIAEREGWQISDVLRIPGHSRVYYNYIEFADDMRAKGFDAADRMFEHWRVKDFDVLAVWHGSRMARELSMFAEVVKRTIDAGARIYDLHGGGWVDKANHRMYAAMTGFAVSQEIDTFIARAQASKDANVHKGIIPSGVLPFPFSFIRDERNKKIGVAVRDDMRPFLDELARVLVEGVAWHKIPAVLAERGYVRDDGTPYRAPTIYRLLHNPVTWGHVARGYNNAYKGYKFSMGRWGYDKSEEPPEFVLINYDCHEPAYTGVQAEKVQAELDRRHDMRGSMRPNETQPFAGLFMCADCGGFYVTFSVYRDRDTKAGAWRGLRCNRGRYNQCDNRKIVPERVIRAYIDALLRRMLRDPQPVLPSYDPAHDAHTEEAMRKAADDSKRKVGYLIQREAEADEADRPFYREQVAIERKKYRRLETQLHDLRQRQEARARQSRAVSLRIDELRTLTLERFWEQDSRSINQFLRALLDGQRFAVRGLEIVDLRPYRRPGNRHKS